MMTMTEAGTETGAGIPAVLIVSASEIGNRSGRLLRHLANGTVIRIDDLRLGETVGWLTAEAPESVRGVALVAPGEAADAI